MTAAAITAHERHPDKRLVVHYMQPHYPFVPAETTVDTGHLDTIQSPEDTAAGENVWSRKFTGDLTITRDSLWEYYTANLRYVLDHVEDLLAAVSGKTIVTSDHGNYVGERAFPVPIREYGHPRGLYDEPVIRVPWLECPHDDRRDIARGDRATDDPGTDSAVVDERLRALGYVD